LIGELQNASRTASHSISTRIDVQDSCICAILYRNYI